MALRNVSIAEDGTIRGERELSDGDWIAFEAGLALFWIDKVFYSSDEAADAIWDRQDGYGEPGYLPEQGWDWSGIRDSTPAAVADMLTIARRYLPDDRMAQVLGVTEEELAVIVANLDRS